MRGTFFQTILSKGLATGVVASLLFLLNGCAGKPEATPFEPHENLLSITTEFLLTAPADPYRQEPGKDLLGFNAARSTLARLRNYQQLFPERFAPERMMLQARVFELLGEYDGALRSYQEVDAYDTEMTAEATKRASALETILVIESLTPQEETLTATLDLLRRQVLEYRTAADQFQADPFYRGLAAREAENAEVLRAELLVSNRITFPDGEQQALEALRRLIEAHRESHRSLEHVYRLARFHRELAEEEIRLHQPDQLGFDGQRFRKHYEAANNLLYRLSQADGSKYKPLAARELDAVLQLGELVSGNIR